MPQNAPPDASASARSDSPALLVVEDLQIAFGTDEGTVRAVDGVSFEVRPGEILGVVGESGSGKSVTVMSLLGLITTKPGKVGGTVTFQGKPLNSTSARDMRSIRGKEIGMIFQDPMTALNPVMRIGDQISEAVTTHHRKVSRKQAHERAVELLTLVGVPQPEQRARQYPHQFSGGMRQRAMIAMAIANDPALLIADEPTTALDVTIQAQVLDMLRVAQAASGAATIFITHDLGVVSELAERVLVMYGGRIMETGRVADLFRSPRHPYTVGLLNSMPALDHDTDTLTPIPGSPPNLLRPIEGCPFQPRCDIGRDREICGTTRPPLTDVGPAHASACHFPDEAQTRREDLHRGRDEDRHDS